MQSQSRITDLTGPPPLESDDTLMQDVSQIISQPRPSISFTIKSSARPLKRRIESIHSSPTAEADLDLREVVAGAKQRRIDPVNQSTTSHSFPLRRTSSKPSNIPAPQPAARDRSQNPHAESGNRANRILFGGDLSEPLCATDLRIFLHENERAKMTIYYQKAWERKKEKELILQNKSKATPPVHSFTTRLLDECVSLNIGNPLAIGRDREGKDITGATRYRGGSGIDILMSKTLTAGGPPPYQVSLVVSLFQHGLSINSDEKNWHPYNSTSISMLRSIDRGEIPPFFSLFTSLPVHYYDGCIIVEIRDFRCITFNPIAFYPGSSSVPREPKITRVVLRPTAESIMHDVQHIMHENRLDSKSESVRSAAVLENEILKATRPDLCLTPTPRVFQILNIAHYSRNVARVRACTKDESKQRIHELYELMKETMFGVDVPVVSPDGTIMSLTSVQQQAFAQANQLAIKARLSSFLQRQPSIRYTIKERLLAKIEAELSVKVIKKEDVSENEFEKMTIMPSPVPPVRSTIRVKSEDMFKIFTDPEELIGPPRPPISTRMGPLLAYASFIHHTEQSRRLYSSNLLVQDPLARRTYTSGPYSQERRAEAIYREKVSQYETAKNAGQTIDPPQRSRPLTILNHGEVKPADKARVSQKVPDQWIVYKFIQPQQTPATSKSKLTMIELHVHAIGIRSLPTSSSQSRQTPQYDFPSGRYEAYLRISMPHSHEATATTICCPLGTEADMKRFVDRFIRMAMREGRQVMGPADSSTTPTIVLYDEHSYIAELEAKHARWTQWEEDRKAVQRSMQQQVAMTNPQQSGTQQVRRTTGGKTTGKTLPHMSGPMPHSTLGLPPGASQTYGGVHPAATAQTSRMPAGFYAGSSRAPLGTSGPVPSISPAPTQTPTHTMPQSPRTTPAVAPGQPINQPVNHPNGPGQQMMYQSTSVPPQHPQHSLNRSSSGSLQHPNQPPMYPPNVSPQPSQHNITPEQQQRMRENQQRSQQQRAYQQQAMRSQQPGPPNPGLAPAGYAPPPHQQQPQMTQQQYAEYQRKAAHQQQMAQRGRH